MQFSTLVLPAPLGPIRASNSPASIASDMPSSPPRPPNRKRSESIVSSAIPPPTAAILLDAPIAPAIAAGRLPEIEFLDIAVRAQPRALAVEYDPAVFEHITVIGHAQSGGSALCADNDRRAELVPDLPQPRH